MAIDAAVLLVSALRTQDENQAMISWTTKSFLEGGEIRQLDSFEPIEFGLYNHTTL